LNPSPDRVSDTKFRPGVRAPAHREHRFHGIVNTDSTAS
jgi:hypothetical protein